MGNLSRNIAGAAAGHLFDAVMSDCAKVPLIARLRQVARDLLTMSSLDNARNIAPVQAARYSYVFIYPGNESRDDVGRAARGKSTMMRAVECNG